ncbi:hypothetical protein TREMEDRAFT_55843 [Tremella mesenterica DSM 1558]|nr:uncharacterized protein TREMEDRAFT_55843 [Tremella mesenterica DSM 1558]EIW72188.1 hypothetical protein TREMEDRAFT_55843 [Tremella mesenterica DSM 1558]
MPQSAIWSFEPSSKKLFARYVNSDGRSVPTKFVTGGGCQHFICLVADVHAFQDVFGEEASEVDLMATALGKLTE